MYKLKKKLMAAALAATAAVTVIAGGIPSVGASALTTSSDLQDAGKAYFEFDYRYLDDENSVFQTLTYEEAVYLFQQEGTYLVLFGGSWCPNTTSIIDYVNYAAKQAGVEAVYNLDFRLDGTNSDTHIRETDGNSSNGAKYNYLYGELVSRYLTNLDDWIEYTSDRATALTYVNSEGEEVTVGKVQVPFLFLYNKDNTVRNYEDKNDDRTVKTKPGEADENGNLKTYPIVYGFERMVYRKSGTKELYTSSSTQDESTYVSDYSEQLDSAIFSHIGRGEGKLTLSDFSCADYIRLSYNEKSGKEIFVEDERINIKTLTYRQLEWLLDSDGDYLLFFGGSWSKNAQELIKIINDYAVKNHLTVYNFDFKLDGGYANIYWGYTKDAYIADSENEFAGLYERVMAYLPNGAGDASFLLYEGEKTVYAAADKDTASAVYGVLKAYEQRTGQSVSDLNGSAQHLDVSRIIALAIGIVVIAATLFASFLFGKNKRSKSEAFVEKTAAAVDTRDGCGGCEAELAQTDAADAGAESESTEGKSANSDDNFTDPDGGCGGFDDDDSGCCC